MTTETPTPARYGPPVDVTPAPVFRVLVCSLAHALGLQAALFLGMMGLWLATPGEGHGPELAACVLAMVPAGVVLAAAPLLTGLLFRSRLWKRIALAALVAPSVVGLAYFVSLAS